jgi:starch synthase
VNVAIVASEAVPLAKTGGLADVAGALPRALEKLGHQVSLFLPYYSEVNRSRLPITPTGLTFGIPLGSKTVEGSVQQTQLPNSTVPVYLIDQPAYYAREGLYQTRGVDYPDNCERFVFFDRAVLEAIRGLGLRPDVVHCNDWQTGLIPVYLREVYADTPELAAAGTLMTIHNLAYQGLFSPADMALTGLDPRLYNWQELEFYGRLSLLKAGLVFADLLSTVSPTYAREIQEPVLGCGLDGLLRARRNDLFGIVNGIDTAVWNPASQPILACRYDASNFVEGKAACKAQLQRRASLPERTEIPLLSQIGRLDPQKGWDLVAEVADDLLRSDVQMVVLGQGLPRYHELLDRLAAKHSGKLRAFLEFSSPLAQQIEAGSDLFIMPSLYEPCGLNQLYSLAYGTVPVVRATGGLADTVVDVTPETLADGTANGFVFQDPTPEALRGAVERALNLWHDRTTWDRIVGSGMLADWSWDHSARQYVALYDEARNRGRRRAGLD